MDAVASQTIYPAFEWEMLILVVGMIAVGVFLLGLEIFILPGFGVGGILGLIFLLGGTGTAWIMLGPTWGALIVVLTCATSMAMFIKGMKSKFVQQKLVHSKNQSKGDGSKSSGLAGLIGMLGTSSSDLRPSGVAMINGLRLDVISDGGFINKNSEIVVAAVEGSKIIVNTIKSEQTNTQQKV